MSPEERRQWWSDAKDKYNANYKYNELRDEIADFRAQTENLKSVVSSLQWKQVPLSSDDLSLFA